MSVKYEKTPQKAAKLVQSALELDGENRTEEAYVKYLDSISFIAASLRENRLKSTHESSLPAEIHRLTKRQAQKLLVVARQCLDRIETLTDDIEDDDVVIEEPDVVTGVTTDLIEIDAPPDMLLSRPLSTLAAVRVAPTKKTATNSNSIASATKPNSNSSILEAIDWVSREEPNLEDELLKADAISPLEKASRENECLIASYRLRIERTPTAGARSNLQLELQRRIAENLEMARQKQASFAARSNRLRQKQLDNAALTLRLRGNEVSSKRLLRLLEKTLDYEQKQRIFAKLREKLENIPVGSVDLKTAPTVTRKTLADPNHPLSKEVKASASHVFERIRQLLDDAVNLNNNDSESDMCNECGHTELDLKDEKVEWSSTGAKCATCKGTVGAESQMISGDDLTEETIGFEEVYRRGTEQIESAMMDGAQTIESLQEEAAKNKKIFNKLKSSIKLPELVADDAMVLDHLEPLSLKSGFENCVQTIRDAIEDLVDSFALVYGKAFDDDAARDACRVHIEGHFYPPIYPSLLNLCRLVHSDQEQRLHKAMKRLVDCRLADLGYRDAALHSSSPSASRCEEAAVALKQFVDCNVPTNKLALLVQLAKSICRCNKITDEAPTRSISADDLIPLLSYACIRASKPQLVSECFLLEALTNQRNLMGEEGYCLTSLQTSLQYIASLSTGLDKPKSATEESAVICPLETTV